MNNQNEQVIFWITSLLIAFFSPKLYQALKWVIWNNSLDWIEFYLDWIWRKAGVIVIEGGAESGKTLACVLLLKYFTAKKWTNLVTLVPSVKKLTLEVLKEHRKGIFNDQIGQNHCLIIDDAWEFFSSY